MGDFKTEEKARWDSVAAGWKKWWSAFERGAGGLSEEIVASAGIGAGMRVLDLATGIGEPAVTAAKRVGPSGRVVAADFSPQMLAIAAERAASHGLVNVETRVVDGDLVDFAAASFDAITIRWGLMFFERPAEALKGLRGLLKPGGRLAAAVWADPPKVPLLAVPAATVRTLLNAPPPPPGPGPFALADEAALRSMVAAAGFRDVTTRRVPVPFDFESPLEYVSLMKDCAAPINALLDRHPPETRARAWSAVEEAARKYLSGGRVKLTSESIVVTGVA
jgi:SAM-dependent methyltransferase